MEEMKGRVVVNIKMENCTTTIAPAAEQAIQIVNIYGDTDGKMPEMHAISIPQSSDMPQRPAEPRQTEKSRMGDDAIRLRKYCDDDESWKKYMEYIRTCKSATELAKIIVDMAWTQNSLLQEDSTKRSFLEIVISLATEIESGRTIGNVRQRVYDAQQRKKRR